jgi:hypothetical protein
MLYFLVELATEHPVVSILTAIGGLLTGVAAVIDARAARHEAFALRGLVTDLDKRVHLLEHK